MTVRWGANVRLNVQFPSSWISFLFSWVFPLKYVIRNLYDFYNLTSCENVPDTYFPLTTPIFLSLPNSPLNPFQTLRPWLLVHCLTAQRGTYTSSEHLTVHLNLHEISLLMYVSRTITLPPLPQFSLLPPLAPPPLTTSLPLQQLFLPFPSTILLTLSPLPSFPY